MRARVAVAGIFSGVLATLLAGCNINDLQYSRGGIGSELAVNETVTATANEDAYLGLICRQAGLPTIVSADGAVYCDQSADWGLIAQSGMNDIDRRCDAYLLWLDDKRRSNEPFLKELAALSAATLGVLDATSAGVRAITITGIAFGLAANTFTNINARLLSLEQSTVQAVVLDNQHQYRLNNPTSAVNNRPSAIYYLRNYLRICLPFSIETSVNNTVAVFHRSGPGALTKGNALFTRKVVTSSKARLQIPEQAPQIMSPTRLNDFERDASFTSTHIREIQRSLCVARITGDLGSINSPTRQAIRAFLGALGDPNPTGIVIDRVDDLLGDAIAAVPDCKKAGLSQPSQVAGRLKKS